MTCRVDHILDLGLCGVLAASPHGGVQLLGGEHVISIIIMVFVTTIIIIIISITIIVSYLGRNGPVHIPVEHVKRLLERLQLVRT